MPHTVTSFCRLKWRRATVAGVALAALASATASHAQRIWVGPGIGGFSRTAPKWAKPSDFDGTFLYWVDDFWGTTAWSYWVRQLSRIMPPGEYPIFDIPATHPIMHTLYDVQVVPQVPSINFWYRRGRRQTSERGADSAEVHFRGIQDAHGRLMVVMSHNTDIADTWEREAENREYFDRFSPAGYAIGVNVVLYAMTH